MSVVITAVVSAVTSFAENAATGQDRWPGPLDQVRRHAWIVLGVGLGLALLLALSALFHEVRSSPTADDPTPPPTPEIPQWVVDRAQAKQVAAELGRARRLRSVGITTAAGLHGAGGFGKSTLAEMVWADRRVRRRFRGRIYRVTLGLDVRSRAEITAKVAETTRFITGDTTVFDDPDLAGAHLGRLLDTRPPTLLILDDVWSAEQLAPFLTGGAKCRRLITTRLPEVLPGGAYLVRVDEMSAAQARQVLAFGLADKLPEDTMLGLLRATGCWPLLLRICNRYMRRRFDVGMKVPISSAEILRKLVSDGPAGLDPRGPVDLNDPCARQTAVTAAVEAGTDLLPAGGFERFIELGVFAEDESVPVGLIIALWQATGSLCPEKSRDLISDLGGLSLLDLDSDRSGSVRLHDVIRDLLRNRLGDGGMQRVNGALVDAVAAGLPLADPQPGGGTGPVHAWWLHSDRYITNHVVTHLRHAGRAHEAETLALDLRWIEHRLTEGGATAALADMSRLPSSLARQAATDFARSAHLFEPVVPAHALGAVLRSRLAGCTAWRSQAGAWQSASPALHNRWPLPDTPDPAQIRVLASHIGTARAVAFSPDGTWLATASDVDTVRMCHLATGRTIAILAGHSGRVNSVAVSPDGTWLATGGHDGVVRIWDVATGHATATLTGHGGHSGRVNSVAVSPDGTWLATGGHDGVARIWDVAAGQVTATLPEHSGSGPVNSVAVSPDGTWLATGGHDGVVRIWDVATGHATATLAETPSGSVWRNPVVHRRPRGPTMPPGQAAAMGVGTRHTVKSLAISPDGTWLVTGGNYGGVRIWDLATGQATATLTGHSGSVNSVAISPDGTQLATGDDGTVRIWNATAERATHVETDASYTGLVDSVAVSPDGTWIAAGCDDGRVRFWNVATGLITAVWSAYTGWVTAVAVSPDGTRLAVGGNDGELWGVNVLATALPPYPVTGHTYRVNSVAISPDGTWLATASTDRTVLIWDMATRQITATLTGHTYRVNSVAISPDGTWLATASTDRTVLIWDMATRQITATLTGHTYRVNSVAISPDGTWLATASTDRTVLIWDMATRQITATLTGHTDSVNSVAISPDGTWLATASTDRTVRIWDHHAGNLITVMRAEGTLHELKWTPTGDGLAAAGELGLYLYGFTPGTPPAN
ncbi:NB-ARC domain-containing protein [Streptomyces sp. NBC_00687]|uniref:NB-ARC domain-containing protein n=1 Tax=Streptomyces sp. NBC_00687 TaxID=2975807 RepID=UPI002251FE31|nr:NB-ARC domain-containing protein [Streptomyces sp. NBC_00687]MCX4920003.1 NB-ARC domain-containing protein [Streptomyces sp. NBC_00687]